MSYLFGNSALGGGDMTLRGGDGGGGGGGPVTQTSNTSNIPEYARPYVETMLGAGQQQVYNMDSSGNVTGIKPYQPYSTNPSDYVAGFSPMQQQAQQNVAAMKTPGEFNQAAGMTGMAAGMTGWNAGNEAMAGQNYTAQATNPYAVQAYMNPYVANSLAPQLQVLAQQTGIQSANQQAAATSAGAFGGSRSALANALAQQSGNLAAQQAIGQGYNQAFNNAQQAQQFAANIGLQGQQAAQAGYGQQGQLAMNLANIGNQRLGAEQGIANLQSQFGGQQQNQQQQIINQAVQNYAMEQQYPQAQLGFINSLIRGMPLQSTVTQGYQAAPSMTSQLAGLGTAGLGAYGLYNSATKKRGGRIREKVGDGIDSIGMYNAMKGA